MSQWVTIQASKCIPEEQIAVDVYKDEETNLLHITAYHKPTEYYRISQMILAFYPTQYYTIDTYEYEQNTIIFYQNIKPVWSKATYMIYQETTHQNQHIMGSLLLLNINFITILTSKVPIWITCIFFLLYNCCQPKGPQPTLSLD